MIDAAGGHLAGNLFFYTASTGMDQSGHLLVESERTQHKRLESQDGVNSHLFLTRRGCFSSWLYSPVTAPFSRVDASAELLPLPEQIPGKGTADMQPPGRG